MTSVKSVFTCLFSAIRGGLFKYALYWAVYHTFIIRKNTAKIIDYSIRYAFEQITIRFEPTQRDIIRQSQFMLTIHMLCKTPEVATEWAKG